jgi:acyl-CoA reductase-like NAD-dependent aldehyde dehydrogenase
MTVTYAEWQARALAVQPRTQAFINGEYVHALSGKTFERVSPRDGRVIAHVAECDAPDVDRAVKAARAAFEDGRWAFQKPVERKRVLLKLADLMREHLEELALLETLDTGKPIGDSLRVDVPFAANYVQWYAEAIDKQYDEIAPTGRHALALITREPLGVVGAVVPWNYPLIISAWKFAPALAVGNSVILKPAEQSPLSALRLAELAMEAGIPEGVFNVVPGFGPTAGAALGRHMDVDKLTFTGSTEVGKYFLRYASESNLKSVGLECGGKSPQVVMADAPDLDAVASGVAWGIFYNQGETCHAGSRLLVQRSIKDDLLERVKQVTNTLRLADPLDPTANIGAMVSSEQMGRVLDYIAVGQQEGAHVALGGEQVMAETGGYYIPATILDNVQNHMRVAREEIFGPVLVTTEFDTPEEAVRLANDTSYGLAASVWSRDITTAHRVARALRAGTVWINCFDVSDITVPFGGFKQSGNGSRDKSLHAFEQYTQLKTTWVQL